MPGMGGMGGMPPMMPPQMRPPVPGMAPPPMMIRPPPMVQQMTPEQSYSTRFQELINRPTYINQDEEEKKN